ncbi:rho guanine nucleotide exchange factor 1 [Pezoporus occidentalis]|uniref:rho guanine nucleotide exchange factor 1 n=1 Tax=Pezoporus occidentalis TaxID=407982 RepID=UPI002F91B8B2
MGLTISSDEEKSSAIFGAIVTYMKHLGVRAKGSEGKKSRSHFFRKKHSGARKPEEPQGRARRGFLLPGGALWGRDPQAPEGRHGKGSESEGNDPPPEVGGEPPGSFLPLPPPPEAEPEPEPWRVLVPPPVLQGLSKSERRRQEVIDELVLTEGAHVRVLRVLLELFYGPALRGGFFPAPDLHNIFPGLEDLVEAHALFLGSLRRRQEESGFVIGAIGDLLLARVRTQTSPKTPKTQKHRKDARFNHLIQEAESHPRCRRLQLRDIIPSEMQRLTKYPLLLQSISACTEEPKDRARVEKAAECCRRILDHVNREVRDMENLMKLKDYQRRLDLSGLKQSSDPLLSEFKCRDLTKRTLVHEGPLSWRLSRDKAVEVQVLLLDDLLVLLQRQDERFLLRCHSRSLAPAPDGKRLLSPVLRLRAAMTRLVATDPKAFYVIISWDNGAQIYELGAQTVAERKNWCDLINETAGALPLPGTPRGKGGRGGAPPPTPLEEEENGGGVKETLDEVPVLGTAPPLPGEGGLAAAALQRVAALRRLLPSPLPPPRDETEAPDGGGAGVTEPPPYAAGVGEELRGLEEVLLRLKELEESWQLQQALGKRGPTGAGDT